MIELAADNTLEPRNIPDVNSPNPNREICFRKSRLDSDISLLSLLSLSCFIILFLLGG